MAFENRNYIIFNMSEIGLIDFAQVLETSLETIRKSVDGTKTFVKWDGNTPACIANLTTDEGPYTNEEILVILSTEEWAYPFNL
jgi:hypothetical protein